MSLDCSHPASSMISQEGKEKPYLEIWGPHLISVITVLSISAILALSILTTGLKNE